MEICKMITLSTIHITPDTAIRLEREVESLKMGIILYPKDEFGWFIYIPEYFPECFGDERIPDDLKACMQLAKDNDCTWLCLDRDGEPYEGLPEYSWDNV